MGQKLDDEFRWQAEGLSTQAETQVLGVDRNTESDTLSLSSSAILKVIRASCCKASHLTNNIDTLRPLGLISTVVLIGKLFQDTWSRGIGWHETLPSDLGTQWSLWCSSLYHESDISAPRWIGTTDHDLDRHTTRLLWRLRESTALL